MKIVNIIKIILAACLLICLIDMPYGYYQFVRFLALAGFAFLSYNSYKSGRQTEMFVFGTLALLYQPFYKIYPGHDMWNILDMVVAVGLLISIWFDRKKM